MKRVLFIIAVVLCAGCCMAQADSKPNLLRLSAQMQKLWKERQYLEAMDTAVYILSLDNDHRVATDFVYRNWDRMQQWSDQRLQSLYDEESVDESVERCEIYRLLDEINTNLRTVKMPLYGPKERWVWQPEINYYSGHYDTERVNIVRLLMRKADEALKSYDTETAKQYYELALEKYLLTEGEQKESRETMLRRLDASLKTVENTDRLHEAIFAYELMELSLTLEPGQEDMQQRKDRMQQRIANLYLEAADSALVAGDSVAWKEYSLSYEDWKQPVPDNH